MIQGVVHKSRLQSGGRALIIEDILRTSELVRNSKHFVRFYYTFRGLYI